MSQKTALCTVVIAGNPNTGKTTVFNQLTGGRAKVGNYPGITVGQHRGRVQLPDGRSVDIVDSPGTYSLSAQSADEMVALSAIAGLPPLVRPDLAVVVVDATQLTRNLYFVLQVIELNLPVIVALNMMDVLERKGQQINTETLSTALGVPVVPIVARRDEGFDQLRQSIAALLDNPTSGRPGWRWQPTDPRLLKDINAVADCVPSGWSREDEQQHRALALWSLLSLDSDDELSEIPSSLRHVVEQRREAARLEGRSIDRQVIEGRYGWIDHESPSFQKDLEEATSLTDRIDRIVLHPFLGFVLFLGLMTLLFQSLFTWSDPLIGVIETGQNWIGAQTARLLPEGLFADFVVNGLIGGVGAFLVFLPQILLLFLFIGIMEDSGYMARIAVLMDRIMKSIGLHGRAFVPMLSGFACAVPAIMATRNMERQRDRFLTMMVVPLMTCSARLPVYGLLVAALFPPSESAPYGQGLIMAGMYIFATVIALICAFVLGRTVLKGPNIPLLIEMPPYRMPHWPSVFRMMWEQGREFITKAGTIILVCSIAMWVLLTFPRDPELAVDYTGMKASIEERIVAAGPDEDTADLTLKLQAVQADEAGALARASYAGQLGRVLEPVLEPLGFDWRIGIGIVGAFAAREVFVSTMGVVFGIGDDVDEDSPRLRERLAESTWEDGRPVFTPLVCFTLMVFFALACQCLSTLAVVKRETASWRWPLFLFGYMTALAWVVSFLVRLGGHLLGFA